MPRHARKYLNGNLFHIIIQGINKEEIFYKEIYKNKFKIFMKDNFDEFNIDILAYCIMSNHTHILINTEKIEDVSKCMHKLNGKYARYYNFKENRVGYVFRDRYYVRQINNQKHLLACFSYIHKNPVKANIVEKENEYKFSSFNEYVNEKFLINKNAVVFMFGTDDKNKYLNEFYMIHKITYNEKIMEVEEDVDYKSILSNYRKLGYTDKRIVNKLYYELNISQMEIADILGITRYNVRKLLG